MPLALDGRRQPPRSRVDAGQHLRTTASAGIPDRLAIGDDEGARRARHSDRVRGGVGRGVDADERVGIRDRDPDRVLARGHVHVLGAARPGRADPDRGHDPVGRQCRCASRSGRRCSRPRRHPGRRASPDGFRPTGIVAVTVMVDGSIRDTAFRSGCETQTAPSPAAASATASILRRSTIVLLRGSIRARVELRSSNAQTEPSPAARAPGYGRPGMLATTLLPRARPAVASSPGKLPEETRFRVTALAGAALTRATVSDSKLLTQTESCDRRDRETRGLLGAAGRHGSGVRPACRNARRCESPCHPRSPRRPASGRPPRATSASHRPQPPFRGPGRPRARGG